MKFSRLIAAAASVSFVVRLEAMARLSSVSELVMILAVVTGPILLNKSSSSTSVTEAERFQYSDITHEPSVEK